MGLGLIPIFVQAHIFLDPGYPYVEDGLSNLLPVIHVRDSLLHGQLPIYTDLWYGGEYQPFNPLWKGFYPFWWPMYIPGLSMLGMLRVILAAHYVAATVIAYWYASKDFKWYLAAPFALAFVTPMALFGGHYEKVLSWPWVVALIWQLVPSRITAKTQRYGLIAGVCLGAMLLSGGMYYFFHTCVILGCVLFFVREQAHSFIVGLFKGSLVGVPKIVISILPVIIHGADRPSGTVGLSALEFLTGLVGFWIDASDFAIELGTQVDTEGFYPIGIGVMILAACAFLYGYLDLEHSNPRWLLGVGSATILGVLLLSRWTYFYKTPVDTFRVAARAENIVALSLLLATWYMLSVLVSDRHLWGTEKRRSILVGVATILLISSAASGLWVWSAFPADERTYPTAPAENTADFLVDQNVESVWIEGRPTFGTKKGLQPKTPYQKPVAYELQQRGVKLQAVNYGKIGQEYSAREDGERTFDALVIGQRLPSDRNRVTLTGGWTVPDRGTIDPQNWELVRTQETPKGTHYVYLPANRSG